MNAEEYKRLINENDVLDHTTLNIALKEVTLRQEFELANEIQRILMNNKIEKPHLHNKRFDTTTNFYKIDLSLDDITKFIEIFSELEVMHVSENGETTPTASFYASLVDKWNRLIIY
jgi:hypothetical protein